MAMSKANARRRAVALGGDRRDVERRRLAPRVVAGERTPDDRDVDAAVGDGVDDVALRIGLRVVAVDREAAHVLRRCGARPAPAPPADCCSRRR